jgi:murein DD-endopeptidase MepM/ murein hydrolase activator NlpD
MIILRNKKRKTLENRLISKKRNITFISKICVYTINSVIFLLGNQVLALNNGYYLPYDKNVELYVTNTKGHAEQQKFAVDFAPANDATPEYKQNINVLATKDGEVIKAVFKWNEGHAAHCEDSGECKKSARNNYVEIDHGGGISSLYLHLQQDNDPPVKVGDKISQGTIIGKIGNTGESTKLHLHFQIQEIVESTPYGQSKDFNFEDVQGMEGAHSLKLQTPYPSENIAISNNTVEDNNQQNNNEWITGEKVIAAKNGEDFTLKVYQDKDETLPANLITRGSIGTIVEDNGEWIKVNWGSNKNNTKRIKEEDIIGWSQKEDLRTQGWFNDVNLDHTFAEEIYQLVGDVFTGTVFEPDKNMTRQQFAKFLFDARGYEIKTCGKEFSDIAGYLYEGEMNTLYCKGIVNGYSNGLYGPEDNILRQEMAKIINGAFFKNDSIDLKCGKDDFEDVDNSSEFYKHIRSLQCREIIHGHEDGNGNYTTYKPEDELSRGEGIKFIFNSINKFIGSTQDKPILPDVIDKNSFIFKQVESGLWYDPPTNYGFEFEMLEDSLFTDIVNFPVGIDSDNIFTVFANGQSLGEYSPGESVNFAALLGEGVSKFTIGDIDSINPEDPTAFPIQLKFNTDVASFKMTSIVENKKIPEPSGIIGLVVIGIYGIFHKNKK